MSSIVSTYFLCSKFRVTASQFLERKRLLIKQYRLWYSTRWPSKWISQKNTIGFDCPKQLYPGIHQKLPALLRRQIITSSSRDISLYLYAAREDENFELAINQRKRPKRKRERTTLLLEFFEVINCL